MKKRGHCTSLHYSPIIASFSVSSAIPEARTKRECGEMGYQSRIRREWKFRSPEVTQISGLPGESAARVSTGVVQQTLSTSTVTFDLCQKMLYLVCGYRLQTGASSEDPSLVKRSFIHAMNVPILHGVLRKWRRRQACPRLVRRHCPRCRASPGI
jgi:hypothetical protein